MTFYDFQYDEKTISSRILPLLKEREETCSSIFSDSTTFLWTKEKGINNEDKYVLIRRGLVDWRIAAFTEDELRNLDQIEFLSKISLEESEKIFREEKQYVTNRIIEWVNRLNNLFSEISLWTPSDYKIIRSEIVQRTEGLMRKYNVKPVNVPTLTIQRGKRGISFVPSALWIIGADGRVNVTTKTRQFILVDRREEDNSSGNWQIVVSDIRRNTIPFDRQFYLELLKKHV